MKRDDDIFAIFRELYEYVDKLLNPPKRPKKYFEFRPFINKRCISLGIFINWEWVPNIEIVLIRWYLKFGEIKIVNRKRFGIGFTVEYGWNRAIEIDFLFWTFELSLRHGFKIYSHFS